MSPPFPPLYLAGQTGSGKTSVALALAKQYGPVEIVNADAYQVYREMDILTAAPLKEERETVPHHLFGILDPSEECDAATFATLAKQTIAEVSQRARPLVVSGSGLYLKAITHGLAPTPPADPELRKKLDQLAEEELIAQYKAADPAGAGQTNLKNRRYVTRNLEITLLAGRPASEIKSEWQENQPDIAAVYLHREREDIYDRINRRTFQMFDAGVVEEVAALGPLSNTAARAIGVREIQAFLAGEMERDTCLEEIQTLTRRYAKRQEIWFRRDSAFLRIPLQPGDKAEEIASSVAKAALLS
ncbi:MAG: tRNA (adenosine(37)-N6)-dimethylallyltransferase MiaA [Verrucomicrobiales bacterium]|nr:tRNA (adenosine(37)-N6)-dimethylallyltransferase MiaA [Verrucomicrobiales bacterium]